MKHYLKQAVDAVEIYRTPEKIMKLIEKETMQREIKFRAFWRDTLKPIPDFNDEYIIDACNDEIFIVNQFTGLKDCNGKEIYEGDIVRWGMIDECWHRYAVVEINPDIQFLILYYIVGKTGERKETDGHIFYYGRFAYKETHQHLEVIGNIYEIHETTS